MLCRKPALVVTPKASGQKGHQPFAFRLLPSLSEAAVVMDKLKPSRNCLRSVKAMADGEREPQLLPTPHYNASLLQVGGAEALAAALVDCDASTNCMYMNEAS